MVQYSFPGKVALVTGSWPGMGEAILEAFGRAGATCIVNYFDDSAGQNRRDAERDRRHASRPRHHGAHHRRRRPQLCFRRNDDETQVAAEAGGLDILVNNAGILKDRTVKIRPIDWSAVIETNLNGVFYCSKLGAEILRTAAES